MHYITQSDYDSFKCIADKCPQNCCEGWQICIDEDSLCYYNELGGEIGKLVRNAIDYKEEAFLQNGTRCAMLRDDGLCELQACAGEEALCYTCGMYPRHIEEYEGVRELSLSLSCPEVARQVVESNEVISFSEQEDDEEDEDFEDFDYLLYCKLVDAREVLYKIVRDESMDLKYRMILILSFCKKLQECIDADEVFEMDDIIDKWQECLPHVIHEDENLMADISMLDRLEVLDEEWPEYLGVFSKGKHQNVFDEMQDWETKALRNILYSLIFTYFCGAVYDDMLYSKAALCVNSVKWIYEIYRAHANSDALNDFDAQKKCLIETTYRFAREVEHSNENLILLDDLFELK